MKREFYIEEEELLYSKKDADVEKAFLKEKGEDSEPFSDNSINVEDIICDCDVCEGCDDCMPGQGL